MSVFIYYFGIIFYVFNLLPRLRSPAVLGLCFKASKPSNFFSITAGDSGLFICYKWSVLVKCDYVVFILSFLLKCISVYADSLMNVLNTYCGVLGLFMVPWLNVFVYCDTRNYLAVDCIRWSIYSLIILILFMKFCAAMIDAIIYNCILRIYIIRNPLLKWIIYLNALNHGE